MGLGSGKVCLLASDVHLGAAECQVEGFCDFLRNLPRVAERVCGRGPIEPGETLLILAGDVVDIWREVNEVALVAGVEALENVKSKGARVLYLPGNHDYSLRYIASGLPEEVGIGSRDRWPKSAIPRIADALRAVLKDAGVEFLDGDYILLSLSGGKRALVTHGDAVEFHAIWHGLRASPLRRWLSPKLADIRLPQISWDFYHWASRQDEEITRVYDAFGLQPPTVVMRAFYDFMTSELAREKLLGERVASLLALLAPVIEVSDLLPISRGQSGMERKLLSALPGLLAHGLLGAALLAGLLSPGSPDTVRLLSGAALSVWAGLLLWLAGAGALAHKHLKAFLPYRGGRRDPARIVENLALALEGTERDGGPWIEPALGPKVASPKEVDAVIVGHFHLPELSRIEWRGKRLLFCDLGSWLKAEGREFCTFLAVCDGTLRLAKYLGGGKFKVIAEGRL